MWIPRNFLNHGLYVVGYRVDVTGSDVRPFLPAGCATVSCFEEKRKTVTCSEFPGAVRPAMNWDFAATSQLSGSPRRHDLPSTAIWLELIVSNRS